MNKEALAKLDSLMAEMQGIVAELKGEAPAAEEIPAEEEAGEEAASAAPEPDKASKMALMSSMVSKKLGR